MHWKATINRSTLFHTKNNNVLKALYLHEENLFSIQSLACIFSDKSAHKHYRRQQFAPINETQTATIIFYVKISIHY